MYILTDDKHRPYLMTPYKEGNNYINAVTVHVSTAQQNTDNNCVIHTSV